MYHFTQHYTEINMSSQKYFVFILLPGIKEFSPKEMELLAKKTDKARINKQKNALMMELVK